MVSGGVSKTTHMFSFRHGLKQWGPLHLQTQCSHGPMVGFKVISYAVKQACTRGGPPISKHNARMVGFKSTHMLSSFKLAQAGGLRGAAAPHLQTHRSHGEWRGFKTTQIGLTHHYLTTTVLTAVIVIFIFRYIFIAIISMCM